MIDPAWLRDEPEAAAAVLARRGCKADYADFAAIDKQLRQMRQQVEQLRAERNASARAVGEKVRAGDPDAAEQSKRQAAEAGAELGRLEGQLRDLQERERTFLLSLPNAPAEVVPDGDGDESNVEIARFGALPAFSFEPRDHVAIGSELGGMDFAAAGQMAQARFVVLAGPLARLQRGLAHFMLDLHVRDHGYIEHYVPYLLNREALTNSGQLPKFGDQVFCTERDDLFLIPTAEGPLVNLAAGRLFDPVQLPLRAVAHTPSFRREAGAHGRDTRGMLRQHQFEKVEMVQVVSPDSSEAALDEMVSQAGRVLELLELPYRTVALCAGALNEASARTIDLEVWMPGQGMYREISSCSNCGDYQARRMGARMRTPGKGPNALVHTLNGSGLAVGRALIAVLENHQRADGSVSLPASLRPYMDGAAELEAEK